MEKPKLTDIDKDVIVLVPKGSCNYLLIEENIIQDIVPQERKLSS